MNKYGGSHTVSGSVYFDRPIIRFGMPDRWSIPLCRLRAGRQAPSGGAAARAEKTLVKTDRYIIGFDFRKSMYGFSMVSIYYMHT